MELWHNDPWVDSHLSGNRYGVKSNITMIAKVCDSKSRRDSWFENHLVFQTLRFFCIFRENFTVITHSSRRSQAVPLVPLHDTIIEAPPTYIRQIKLAYHWQYQGRRICKQRLSLLRTCISHEQPGYHGQMFVWKWLNKFICLFFGCLRFKLICSHSLRCQGIKSDALVAPFIF